MEAENQQGVPQGLSSSSYQPRPRTVIVHEQDHRILAWARDEAGAIEEAGVEFFEQDFIRSKVSVTRAQSQLEGMLRGAVNVGDMPGAPAFTELTEAHHLYLVEFAAYKEETFTYPDPTAATDGALAQEN